MEEPASGPPRRPYLRRAQMSEYLYERWGIKCATATLAKLAVSGDGPPYYKNGRVPLYDPDHADVWARQRLGKPRTSTAAAGE